MDDGDAFENVCAALRAPMQRRGFATLTPVQEAAVATDSAHRNLRISSQTGSGKTVALGLALAEDLIAAIESDASGPFALIITPTRELAVQVKEELSWLFADVAQADVTVVTGGTDIMREQRLLGRRAPILVGTPGRLLDHVRRRGVDLRQLRHVVLDEADQMLEMGFRDELDAIVAELPVERRSHLVSATFPHAVRTFADGFQQDALHLEGTTLGAANADIAHTATLCHGKDRYAALVNSLLLLEGERCLVFVKRRADAADLAEMLNGDGFSAMGFSGELAQAQRTRTLNAFRNGIVRTLVATDVAARGIDVADISTVIHYDLPFDADAYTHRSGRTGRAGQKGCSLLLVPPRSERRMRRMLDMANVEATWAPVPSPKKIKKTLQKRTRRDLRAKLATAESSEAQRTYATDLLAENDAAHVVACLLQMVQPALPREPFEVNAPESAPQSKRERRTDDVRFFVTWGERDGATPSRLIAHLCRRTGISSQSIGAVSIGEVSSSVYIAAAVAQRFEGDASRPDRTDPDIRVRRYRDRSGNSDRPSDRARGSRFERPKQRKFPKGRVAPTGGKRRHMD